MPNATGRRGGWVTFPFITGSAALLALAGNGWIANLMVYLIEVFHVKSIAAAQIWIAFTGATSLLPIVAAIISDSFAGSFNIIAVSSFVSLLGSILITLTAVLHMLIPERCPEAHSEPSHVCTDPSLSQFAVLYIGLALASLGFAGIRFTSLAMGAYQFDKPEDRARFFRWGFVAQYTASVVGATVIVYIQDNVSWGLGFGLCAALNAIALAVFLLGRRLYVDERPRGSPFLDLARVVVAAARKRKVRLPLNSEDYYYGESGGTKVELTTDKFRFLNRAAVKVEGDTSVNGAVTKSWRLCTMQQVEDFKTLTRIFPLWSSAIPLSITIVTKGGLVVIQALAMDRHLGPHFRIPAGSMWIIPMISLTVFLSFIDRLMYPIWQKLTGQTLKPLQRIGAGHVLNALAMVVSAIVEAKRLALSRHNLQPMSSLWLFPQLILVGFGLALHHPGQVSFYYQEFPASLRSTSTAMASMNIGIAYYLSTAVLDIFRRATGWLPDNINDGRVDNVYWTLAAVGVLDFVYYLVCSSCYKYQNSRDQ